MENVNAIATNNETKKLSHICVCNKKAVRNLRLLVASCSQQKLGLGLWQIPLWLLPEKLPLRQVSSDPMLFSSHGLIPTVLCSHLSQTI